MALSRGEYRLVGSQIQRQRGDFPGGAQSAHRPIRWRYIRRGRKLPPGEILTPAGGDERPIQAITGENTSLRSEWRRKTGSARPPGRRPGLSAVIAELDGTTLN